MITYREALHHALREEMTRDERVLIFGEDVVAYGGAYGVTSGLAKDLGEKRVFDAPIAEGVIAGAAVGAAMGGLRPVAELMTINFALLAADQIINHAAKVMHMFGGQRAGRGTPARLDPFAEPRGNVRPRPGAQGGHSGDAGGCQGAAQERHPGR